MSDLPKPVKLKWRRPIDGLRTSHCGRFTITRETRWRNGSYVVTDTQTGAKATRDTLQDAKEWANDHDSRSWPRVFITGRKPPPSGQHGYSGWTITKPDYGFEPEFYRYRVTVEQIDEPEEVKKRILKAWRECPIYRTSTQGRIKEAADLNGVELDPDLLGVDAGKRRL